MNSLPIPCRFLGDSYWFPINSLPIANQLRIDSPSIPHQFPMSSLPTPRNSLTFRYQFHINLLWILIGFGPILYWFLRKTHCDGVQFKSLSLSIYIYIHIIVSFLFSFCLVVVCYGPGTGAPPSIGLAWPPSSTFRRHLQTPSQNWWKGYPSWNLGFSWPAFWLYPHYTSRALVLC